MNSDISPEVRARIDAHLDAVESQLVAAGIPRETRRGIIDDLETQILEMLGIASCQPISIREVNEMLGRLDPPEAYGKDAIPAQQSCPPVAVENGEKPLMCQQARAGMLWIALALLAQFIASLNLIFCLRFNVSMSQAFSLPQPIAAMIVHLAFRVIAVVAPIIGTSLGWIAAERIGRSGGRLYGPTIAAFEALFYPLIISWVCAFLLWYLIIIAYYDGQNVSARGRVIFVIGGSCTAILLSALLGWLLHRLSRRSPSGS